MDGTGFANFLLEIASHGYIVISDGAPGGDTSSSGGGNPFAGLGGTSAQSKVSDMRDSVDWALAGKAAKYGEINPEKVATAGQSCGGLEAYSVGYNDPRVKVNVLFNIAIFNDDQRYLLERVKVPVAYFVGGKNDIGFENVSFLALDSNIQWLTRG